MDKEINTEGSFEYRIKPQIEHGSAHLNRAIEEIQKIIVANKESSQKFQEEFDQSKKEILQMREDLKGLSLGDRPGSEDFDGRLNSIKSETDRIAKLLSDRGIQ